MLMGKGKDDGGQGGGGDGADYQREGTTMVEASFSRSTNTFTAFHDQIKEIE